MKTYEKLGAFYLGRGYDPATDVTDSNPLLYDSKDLLTHALCVGMTGSGKTGLCIGLLEEAAIDGIPSLVVDLKGDLTNLLLTFDELSPAQFRPWINESEAAQKNITPDEFAAKQAALWTKGLAEWDQDADRIRRLKQSADFCIYSPGSTAGVPLSILKSFDVPAAKTLEDSELLADQISTTVTGLLGLLGIAADPVRSREHILLSTILQHFWTCNEALSIESLIRSIQDPPVERIGVFDLESFFPSKDRFELAMQLNNLVAAPGFQSWLQGEPLDIDRLLFTGAGKPRVSVITLAHLNDNERMFFLTLLLTQVIGWMRQQPGTSSLRAILYIDEIFGFMPPVANPPSKTALLTLLKQARAFGLGTILATQNPVDLDYKGLSNIGTWFLGRLQTDRDKQRVLDGLEGVRSSHGGRFDRSYFDGLLSSLGKRVFLMNNVHEDAPVVFRTRWVMSYLPGPLTRDQIRQLTANRADTDAAKATAQPVQNKRLQPHRAVKTTPAAARPMLPPQIQEFFLPAQPMAAKDNSDIRYEPRLVGVAEVYYSNARAKVATSRRVGHLLEVPEQKSGIRWDESVPVTISIDDLEPDPTDETATYGTIPSLVTNTRQFKALGSLYHTWLYHNCSLQLLKSRVGEISTPGEDERSFRIRLQSKTRELRDKKIATLRKKYERKMRTLEDRIARAQGAVQREQDQAKQQKFQTAISLGSTILSSLLGRKSVSTSTLGRASTTLSRAGRISKEKRDVERAKERVSDLSSDLTQLEDDLQNEIDLLHETLDPLTEELQEVVVKPRKRDIIISVFALLWVPVTTGGVDPLAKFYAKEEF